MSPLFMSVVSASMVVAIPIAVLWLGRMLVYCAARREFVEMPVFWRLSILAGLACGIASVLATIPPAIRSIDVILADQGPWDMSLWSLLTTRINPMAVDYEEAALRIAWSGQDGAVIGLLAAAAILLMALGAIGLMSLGWRRGLVVFAVSVMTTLISGWIVFYLLCLLAWTPNTLNFWVLFVALLLLRWPFKWPQGLKPA